MAKNKKITIDDLAVMVQNGFAGVDERLEKIDLDISEIKTDITGIKQRLSALDNRLDTFVDHEKRLTKVESTLRLRVKH